MLIIVVLMFALAIAALIAVVVSLSGSKYLLGAFWAVIVVVSAYISLHTLDRYNTNERAKESARCGVAAAGHPWRVDHIYRSDSLCWAQQTDGKWERVMVW